MPVVNPASETLLILVTFNTPLVSVTSPVCVIFPVMPEYKLLTALSPVLTPLKFATAALASKAFPIAPLAIEVALPTEVTIPVKFAFVVTVVALLAVPVVF